MGRSGAVNTRRSQVSKHVIMAVSGRPDQPDQPRYFLGYKNCDESTQSVWTFEPWNALWMAMDEAQLEARLLAELCPSYQLVALPLTMV
jgi:hypothetical protein